MIVVIEIMEERKYGDFKKFVPRIKLSRRSLLIISLKSKEIFKQNLKNHEKIKYIKHLSLRYHRLHLPLYFIVFIVVNRKLWVSEIIFGRTQF